MFSQHRALVKIYVAKEFVHNIMLQTCYDVLIAERSYLAILLNNLYLTGRRCRDVDDM